jgi:hypothetical protein
MVFAYWFSGMAGALRANQSADRRAALIPTSGISKAFCSPSFQFSDSLYGGNGTN